MTLDIVSTIVDNTGMSRVQFSKQLRRFILNCGESRYAIAKKTGVPEETLSRFVNGRRPLTLRNIDTLCAYLGLELRQQAKLKRKVK